MAQPSPPSLLRHAVRGALWTIITSAGSRTIGLVGTLAITRFLDPDEYGEVSLASIVILTANVFSNCGIGQFLVSRPQAGRAAAFHATFYYTLLGVLALGIAVVVGGPFGAVIHAPTIGRFLPGLALAALLERVGTIQDRILVRDMRFRSVSLQRSLGEVVFSVVSVGLAAFGAGSWWGGGNAIVLASIARSGLRLVTYSATTPRREWLEPCAITWKQTRELFAFGLPMSVASLAGFGSRRWDNLVFSHHFGQAGAGIYNLAYNLADIPAIQIGETIGDVLVPSFAQMRSDERRKAALLLSMRMLLLIVAPLSVGLGAVSPTLVATFFDRRWAQVAPELTILAGLSMVRPVSWIASSYLQVANRPRSIMVIEAATALGVVGSMHVFARYLPALVGRGEATHWACASIGVVFALNSLSYMWVIRRLDGLSLRAQLAPFLGPVVACVPMVLAVFALQHALAKGPLGSGARLALEVAAGALAYVPAAFVASRGAARELVGLLRKALGRAAAPPQVAS